MPETLHTHDACQRLELFVKKLHFLADWVAGYGERFGADGLKDCIPFVLRRLGQEIEEIRDDLTEKAP
jgi:hypothetical protein